tara:strand:+ start:209 stop:340 length:132 start_codon:yes stop_codon:yes gene_type:complete
MENKKEISVGIGYIAGVALFCIFKGFWYGVGIMFAMKLMGVKL